MVRRVSLLLSAMALVIGCSASGPASGDNAPAPAPASGDDAPTPVAGLEAPTPATTQNSGPGPRDIDCDAPSGRYRAAADVGLPAAPWRVTGQVQFLTARDNIFWSAMGSIQVIYSGQNDVVLALLVRRNEKVVRILSATSHEAQPDLRLADALPNGPEIDSMPLTPAQVPFVLALDPSGHLSESIGDIDIPLTTPIAAATRLIFQCSTAHLRFTKVTIEDAGQGG